MTYTTLELDRAGRLAHSLVARTAQDAGIRTLSVKGDLAADYRLRPRRASADADVLVHPSSAELLCRRLEERGWHTRAGRMPPTFIDLHSTTLIHDRWPCDIDVHHFFPGFFAAPADVFELLWAGRDVHRTTGGEVCTPSRAGMAVVLALHAVRSPSAAKSDADLASVSRAVSQTFGPAEVSEFCEIVRGGRAQWVLRDLTVELGLPLAEDDATPSEKALWQKNQQAAPAKATSLWIREVLDAPVHSKIRAVLRALWVPRRHIPRNDPDRLPSHSESWAYQSARWGRGARGLVDYFRR